MNLLDLPKIDVIRFEGMSFAHEGQDAVLKNCDFDFPTDTIVRLKSPEGAGKSTLMQLMAGLLLPRGGVYRLNDSNVVEMSFEEFLPYRLQIGFTFDYGGLINNRTIRDNLLLPLLYHKLIDEDEARQRVNFLLDRFDLQKYAEERPAHIPGRVRKIAVLLRAIVINPQILLLDDPSVGLGDATQLEFIGLMSDLRDKGYLRHVFISSYDEKFMAQMPHEIVHLDGGLLYHQQNLEKKVANL